MGYEPLFWILLVLTVGSIVFSRRDIARWRRMLASHPILIGPCAFSGALAFFPGAPGFILGIAGLLPASVASWQLTRNGLQDKTGNRKAFHLDVAHSQLSPGEKLLQAQDRIDEENEYRSLGRRLSWVFLPALAMGATAINFESWLMGVMALGVAAVSAWTVQPAFAPRPALPVPEKNNQLPRGSEA
jgi:hypothetical protein